MVAALHQPLSDDERACGGGSPRSTVRVRNAKAPPCRPKPRPPGSPSQGSWRATERRPSHAGAGHVHKTVALFARPMLDILGGRHRPLRPSMIATARRIGERSQTVAYRRFGDGRWPTSEPGALRRLRVGRKTDSGCHCAGARLPDRRRIQPRNAVAIAAGLEPSVAACSLRARLAQPRFSKTSWVLLAPAYAHTREGLEEARMIAIAPAGGESRHVISSSARVFLILV
jgi:hypothetical protein